MNAMAIDAIAGSSGSAAAAVTKAGQELGKDVFLKLLVTQLQNQDPLNPADSTEFTSQLAQFSSLEQLSNVNENLDTLKLYQASINNAQAVGFIGKEIVSKGNALEIRSGDSAQCEFELGDAAEKVVVSIYDVTGDYVGEIMGSSLDAGKQSLTWDAKDRNGNTVPDGTYTFEIKAEDKDGQEIKVNTYSKGIVSGVIFENGVTYLVVGNQRVSINDVVQIRLASSQSE
jgi:flagellar basal-body rod modification protein FlgD